MRCATRGPNLDRIQIIKGWLGKDGKTQERILRRGGFRRTEIGTDGRCTTPGQHRDVANASYSNTIGTPILSAYWEDPAFEAAQRASTTCA